MKDRSSNSDILLFKKIKSGNQIAFSRLFEMYYSLLVVFAKKYVNDLDLSKDIVQDFFVKLYEKKDTIEIKSSLKSYLYLSVRNACFNYIEKKDIQSRHHEIIQTNLNLLTEEVSEKIEETELQYEIYRRVEALPNKCQEIFKMSRMKGMCNQDIADELDISKRTVETQISKALKILRAGLKQNLIVVTIWLLQIISKLIHF